MRTRSVLQIHDVTTHEPRPVVGDRFDRPLDLRPGRREAGNDRSHENTLAPIHELANRPQRLQNFVDELPRLVPSGHRRSLARALDAVAVRRGTAQIYPEGGRSVRSGERDTKYASPTLGNEIATRASIARSEAASPGFQD